MKLEDAGSSVQIALIVIRLAPFEHNLQTKGKDTEAMIIVFLKILSSSFIQNCFP